MKALKTLLAILTSIVFYNVNAADVPGLLLNDSAYYEKAGLNILVFNNWYNENFDDSKMSGIEIIHHGVRTVTNGDVRLNTTPEQWDQIPKFIKKEVLKNENIVRAYLKYPDFEYTIQTELSGSGIIISVILDKPLPEKLNGIAGFNLEFLPSAYFGKTYQMDNSNGYFPLYPSGPTTIDNFGKTEPKPIAEGSKLVLAPEDNERRIKVESDKNKLYLYDGRNKAQNGWFVLRSLIPSGKTGKVIEWRLDASTIQNWIRKPVISYSQVGYHPSQQKKAIVELDKNDELLKQAELYKILESGNRTKVLSINTEYWGIYKRYKYGIVDFSKVVESGIYIIKYGDTETKPIRIDKNVYSETWQPSLDIYLPVQMDHMLVNEAYKVWHGASHLDDALQAPVNHKHFDLYAMGATTDSPYKPGEHIPGLNIGGWLDAGDFDIRTQTQYAVILTLVHAWEDFGLTRDETYINQQTRYVDLHRPDGKADILQQIEHGALALIAQHRTVGHAIHGIIESHLSQYHYLGDPVNKTDNLIYNPQLDSLQSDGFYSGTSDDRWAFTTKSTPLNYGSVAGLAAASRALKGFNDSLADECLSTAIAAWDEEHKHKPDIFYIGNTTGGPLLGEELKAAVELLLTTKEQKYAVIIEELWPEIEKSFIWYVDLVLKAMPYMNDSYKTNVREQAELIAKRLPEFNKMNPFGVFITEGGWAGNGMVIMQATNNYKLYKAFPDLFNKEDVYRGLNYIFGCHPDSDISFVSGVGLHSKQVAYGMNRADFTFIVGGIVPGVLILKPDFPENKEDWPFLWGENEYVVNMAAIYIYLANAVQDLLTEEDELRIENRTNRPTGAHDRRE